MKAKDLLGYLQQCDRESEVQILNFSNEMNRDKQIKYEIKYIEKHISLFKGECIGNNVLKILIEESKR